MNSEKITVAFNSIIAAVFLTLIKAVVGIFTGSLGILSEAAHSALDMAAALITFFAVKLSDKPADERHNYGHGKIESFSALMETLLLLVTCIWIIYEAVDRLWTKSYHVEANIYGFIIMIIAIGINISRAISLNKAAKKFNSQALKADALHFSSDVYSSLVVIIGLIFTAFGFPLADAIAALGVSLLVIVATYKLGKDTIEVLLDTAPIGITDEIKASVTQVEGVISCEKVRVRTSGASMFIDINVGLNKYENHRGIHNITHLIKDKLTSKYPNSDISICTFPVQDCSNIEDGNVSFTIKKLCYETAGIKNAHNIKIFNVDGKKHISVHIETDNNIDLKDAHNLVHSLKGKIAASLEDISDVSINLEHSGVTYSTVKDVTEQSPDIVKNITDIVNNAINNISCHNIKIYQQNNTYNVFFHCHLETETKLNELESILDKVSKEIKETVPGIDDLHIHFEPNKQ